MTKKVTFEISYGRNMIRQLENEIKDKKVLVVTQENLWKVLGPEFSIPVSVFFVETMEESILLEELEKIEEFDVTVGLGGGMSIDGAKYFAWKREKPSYFMPTIVSVDACFSYPVAIRINNNVKYVGEKIPERIYVDYEIVRSAPVTLNRSGIGDVLSCYTGLFDWTLMCNAGKAVMNDEYYNKAQGILNEIFEKVNEISDVTEQGIQMIMEGYKWVGETSYQCGYCFFEEGSEHYFAYAIESINKKHLIHGQLVCLGIYVMSKLHQEGRQNKIKELLKKLGLSIKPEDVGVSCEDVKTALTILNDYVIKENLAYSVLNEKKIDEGFINEVLNELKAM